MVWPAPPAHKVPNPVRHDGVLHDVCYPALRGHGEGQIRVYYERPTPPGARTWSCRVMVRDAMLRAVTRATLSGG